MPLERELFEKAVSSFLNQSIKLPEDLYRAGHTLFMNGSPLCVFKINDGTLQIASNKKTLEDRLQNVEIKTDFLNHLKKAVKVNSPILEELKEESIGFIERAIEKYDARYKYVSFSGGKDSSVTAHLVNQVDENIPLLFSNTTIEMPETVKFAGEFAKAMSMELVEVKPNRDFLELVKEFGPPSRIMRWCCFTQKSGPIGEFYAKLDKKVLSFDGMRKAESKSRGNYSRINRKSKLAKQISAYPIFEWSDLAVWLYIFKESLPINPLYLRGYSRVGCWACPNNSKLTKYLTEETHPELIDIWNNKLSEYAKTNGKDEKWIEGDNWKSRRVHYDDELVGGEQTICSSSNSFSFSLNRDPGFSREVVEYLKVFGDFSEKGNGAIKLFSICNEHVSMRCVQGGKTLIVEFLNGKRKEIERGIKKQIEKSLNCKKCGACISVCQYGAITIQDGCYKILEEKCRHCGDCMSTKRLGRSCVALHYMTKRAKIASMN
jgi:phosphoadenosine phosphosulfate reductase